MADRHTAFPEGFVINSLERDLEGIVSGLNEKAWIQGWSKSLTPTLKAFQGYEDIPTTHSDRKVRITLRQELSKILKQLKIKLDICDTIADTVVYLEHAIIQAKLKYLEAERSIKEVKDE